MWSWWKANSKFKVQNSKLKTRSKKQKTEIEADN
jgi:hypothetical protein